MVLNYYVNFYFFLYLSLCPPLRLEQLDVGEKEVEVNENAIPQSSDMEEVRCI